MFTALAAVGAMQKSAPTVPVPESPHAGYATPVTVTLPPMLPLSRKQGRNFSSEQ